MKIIGACATNSGDEMIEQTPPIFPLPPRYIMGKGHVKVFSSSSKTAPSRIASKKNEDTRQDNFPVKLGISG